MGRAPIGEMFIELGLDTTKFSKGTTGARNAVKFFSSEVRALDNVMKSSGKNVDALGKKHQALGKQIEAQKKLIDQLYKAYNDPNISQGRRDTLAAQIGNETAKLKAMEGQLKSVNAELEKMSQPKTLGLRLEEAGKKIDDLGQRIQKASKSISSVGDTMTKGITAPIVAGAGVAIKAAMDYESAFAGVKKTVDGTAQDFDKLSSGIRQMALEMPASAVEIANVAEAAGQLGIKKEDILSFSKTMIDLGESTNLSATEAASAIAKMANITGMASDDYSRFGSAVVALGNNFATTEADIVSMATRMASAGTMAGLTNQEILALATSMSSVGIEAEAGGTAMSQTLTQIGQAVSTASEDVQKFATVAGMSADEFSAKWKEAPMEALQKFIKGLQEIEENGGSASAVLEDLGMNGIRQSNMLKALGLASDKMAQATKLSNDAWRENTALSKEASQRYETTESKLKMLKNQVTDLAIEFGGPLLDAIRDSLEAGKPFLQMMADLAKKFSSLSKEQQQGILKMVGFAAAIGPALSLIGRMGSGIGTLVSGFGKLTGATGKVIGAIKGVGTAAEVASGASGLAGATTQTGLLSGAMGALISPLGLLVAGTGLLAGGAYLLSKAQDEARARTEEFGTALSKTQREELRGFKDKVDETKSAVAEFTSTAEGVERVKNAFKNLRDEVEATANNANQRLQELGEKWGISPEQIQKAQDRNKQMVQNVDDMMNQINEIYDRHKGDASKFSEEEKEIILNNQREMTRAKLELMELSKEQQTAVMKALNGEISQLNETQLKDTTKALKKAMDEENKIFKQSKKELKELYEAGALDKKEYNSKLEQLEREHQTTMEALGTKYLDAMKRLDKLTKERTGQNWNYWEEAKKVLEEYGLSFDDIGKKAQEAAKKGGESTGMLAKYTADMTKETKEANDAWSALVGTINEKGNFELKSNVKEVIAEATQSQEGWEQLMFITKHADLETNARVTIAEALTDVGRWDSMTPEEKELVLDGKKGLQAIFDSKQNLETWNSLPAEVKELLLENNDVVNKADTAKAALENYNKLNPEQKELLVKDENIRNAIASSTESLIQWDLLTLSTKRLDGDVTGLSGVLKIGEDNLRAWNGKQVNPKKITATDETGPAVKTADAAVNTILQNNPIGIFAENKTQHGVTLSQAEIDKIKQTAPVEITAETKVLPATSAAQAQVDSVKQTVPTDINAVDSTGGATSSAQAGIDNVFQRRAADINATNQTQPPATAAQAAIDSVKQKSPTQINAQDNASSVATGVLGILNSIPRNISIAINAVGNAVGKFLGLETGTDYHLGGPAIVNDQKGPLYKELIQLPNGKSFIPQGRNVLLDLPRGTKVLPAAKTRDVMKARGIPHYEKGVGFPDNSFIFREFKTSKPQQESDAVLQVLKQILFELKINRTNPETSQSAGNVYFDTEKVGRVIQERLDRNSRMRSRMRGEINFE